jgi:hypothetical protein
MIIGIIALQIVAAQPAENLSPKVAEQGRATALTMPAERKLASARALLARATQVRANYAAQPGQPSNAELDASIDELKDKLDSLPEMGEMDQLKLQMLMDRASKAQATLSNLLKKISDTQSAVVQNIK